MNKQTHITGAPIPSPVVGPRPNGEAGAPVPPQIITADASKVSGRDFLDAITGRSPEIRAAEREQMVRRCISAIERGDTYGYPPVLVEQCREIMASASPLDMPVGWSREAF